MPIDKLTLIAALSQLLESKGVTEDFLGTDEAAAGMAKVQEGLEDLITSHTNRVADATQTAVRAIKELGDANKALNDTQKLVEAAMDKFSPQPLPQQDMSAVESAQPTPQEQLPVPPASDAGMTPPPEMNVPPVPDMGMSAPDAGMIPPAQSAPDMMQIDPNMLGAVQPRF
jgi:hypothetical protein